MGIIYALAKTAAKLAAKNVTKDINQLASVRAGQEYVWSYREKISELTVDHGLSIDYVKSLIANADDPASLKAIKAYLQSGRNDLPNNITTQLLAIINRKMPDALYAQHLIDMKKQWLAEHSQHVFAHVIDAAKELI